MKSRKPVQHGLWTMGMAAATGLVLFSQAPVAAQGLGSDPSQAGSTTPGAQSSFSPPGPIRLGQPISLLVFPFGYAGGAAGDAAALTPEQVDIAHAAAAGVKAGFLATPAYSVATYHPGSALVAQARKGDILKPEHVAGVSGQPGSTVDPGKARTIAYRLGIQAFLIGTIDLRPDAANNKAEVTLSVQLINSTTGEPMAPTATGAGAAQGTAGVPWIAVGERAAQDAAMKVLPGLGIQLIAPPAPKGKKAPKAAKPAGKTAASKSSNAPATVAAAAAPGDGESGCGAAAISQGNGKVQGVASANGQPDPYGFARSNDDTGRKRNRSGLRIHPWIGLAAFLTGVSFLIP